MRAGQKSVQNKQATKQRKIIETYQIRDGSFNWTADKYVAAKKQLCNTDMLPTGVWCAEGQAKKRTFYEASYR